MSSLDEVGLQQGAELDRESSPEPASKVVRNGPLPPHAPTWKRNLGEMGVEGRESPAVCSLKPFWMFMRHPGSPLSTTPTQG